MISNEQKWYRGDMLVRHDNLDSKERTRIARTHNVMVDRLDVWMKISREFPDADIRAQAQWGVFAELVRLPNDTMRREVLGDLVEECRAAGRGVTVKDAMNAVRRYRKANLVQVIQAERERDNKPALTNIQVEKLHAAVERLRAGVKTTWAKGGFWLDGVKVDGSRDANLIVLDLSESGWALEHASDHGPLRLVLRKG